MSSPKECQPRASRSELAAALGAFKPAFIAVWIFSGLINVLMLTGSMFMLEVYDRVLPSHSVPTLVGLSVLAALLFVFLGIFDAVRARILSRIGFSLDERVAASVLGAVIQLPLKAGRGRDGGSPPVRDLDTIRAFLSGLGPAALFDLPWVPFYLVVCFAFHVLIGLAATVGALILVGLTLMTEWRTRRFSADALHNISVRGNLAEAARRNAEAISALGMEDAMAVKWVEANRSHMKAQRALSDVTGGFGSMSRIFRMCLQSAVLGLGAWLVIRQEASAGIIIASSILSARALAPIDLAIANWRGFVSARQAWKRLSQVFEIASTPASPISLPAPKSSFSAENVSIVPPGSRQAVVQDIGFALKPGSGLGIIGPSASGKSSLARGIVGVWSPARGKFRLDGGALDQWGRTLGRHIGYLPQDVELMAGTVAENIARFDAAAAADEVIEAARAAGIHELILRLTDGYETQVGEQGSNLSAGQQQRIALARALFRNPFLVVLDEPNSNLDADGDEALAVAILGVRKRGGIVIVVAHRSGILNSIDQLLVMSSGRQQAFGPRDDVLRDMRRPPAAPLHVVSEPARAAT